MSTPSVVNASITPVNTVPLMPDAPTRGSQTNTAQLDLKWTDLNVAVRNGGSVVTSYEISWDNGTDG